MRVLVTGGAGYIGSHTCKEPVVYDNLSTGRRELARWGAFVHGDILDTQRLRTAMRRERVEAVIHFAAKAYVGESVINPEKYFRNNVGGTQSLLDAMRGEDVRDIVVSGTCAVYGTPERMPIDESTPANPINPYGESKLFMERMLAAYGRAYGTHFTSLRYFNAAGCDADGETGEWHDPETHLIPRVLMAAAGRIEALEIFGDDYPTPDGTCIRDYVHVKDLAIAHVKALEYIVKHNESLTVNLGSEKGVSVLEMLEAARRITGKPIPAVHTGRRAGDPACLYATSAYAREKLGWQAQYSDIDTLVSSTWAVYKKRGE